MVKVLEAASKYMNVYSLPNYELMDPELEISCLDQLGTPRLILLGYCGESERPSQKRQKPGKRTTLKRCGIGQTLRIGWI